MAELKVEVCKIDAIKDHPNADKLELAYIGGENGWQSCVQIGIHKVGDKVVYIPVDSILPMDVEKILFDIHLLQKVNLLKCKQRNTVIKIPILESILKLIILNIIHDV
jgi:hypothetical protein